MELFKGKQSYDDLYDRFCTSTVMLARSFFKVYESNTSEENQIMGFGDNGETVYSMCYTRHGMTPEQLFVV